jgi:uncharacterized protein YjbJ (UPF0337 family)
MGANLDILKDKWPELKVQAKQHWGKLIDDDIQRLSGTTEELVGVLRQRCGYGETQAEMEINNWVKAAEKKSHAAA